MDPKDDREPARLDIQKGDTVTFFNHRLGARCEGTVRMIKPGAINPVCIEDKDGVRYWRKFEEVHEVR
jgi:hypothetical protein